MSEIWRANIRANKELVQGSRGPTLVSVVSGDATSQRFWQQRFARTRSDVFRRDGSTEVESICEETRKGNFLGTLRAWARTKAAVAEESQSLPPITLMSMVFGQGRRLSPFTQASGNRKPAFLLPLTGESTGSYLCAAEMSNLYANLWIDHLAGGGFGGVLVKWGDEAIVPGLDWGRERRFAQQLRERSCRTLPPTHPIRTEPIPRARVPYRFHRVTFAWSPFGPRHDNSLGPRDILLQGT